MIEDKNIGLKIAENKEIGFWEQCRRNCEAELKATENSIKLNKIFLEAIERQLAKENANII